MSLRLGRPVGDFIDVRVLTYSKLKQLAGEYGWRPGGMKPPVAGETDPTYCRFGRPRNTDLLDTTVCVGDGDAMALADALERALAELPDEWDGDAYALALLESDIWYIYSQPPREFFAHSKPFVEDAIAFFRRGSYIIT